MQVINICRHCGSLYNGEEEDCPVCKERLDTIISRDVIPEDIIEIGEGIFLVVNKFHKTVNMVKIQDIEKHEWTCDCKTLMKNEVCDHICKVLEYIKLRDREVILDDSYRS